MNYFVSVILVLLASLAGGWGLSRIDWKVQAWNERAWVWRVTLLFLLVYLGILCFKLEALQMGGWDFGIYDSMLHNAASGKGLMRDFRGPFDHFSPVFMLFVPLYLIWDHPFWLPLIQSAALALAAPVLHAVAKRYFPRGIAPFALMLMYLLNPYWSRLALYDFHVECLFPLVCFAAFYYYGRNKLLPFALLLMLSPLIKEDFVVPLGAAGLWLLTQKGRRKLGLGMIGAALLWTLFVLKIYFPWILGAGYWHYGRYEILGGTAGETARNFLAMAARVVHPDAFAAMLSLLLPFALLPVVNWKMLLFFWLPTLGIQLISINPSQRYLQCHYAAALVAVTPIAALWGMRTLRYFAHRLHLRKVRGRRVLAGGTAVLVVLCHVVYSDLPLSRYADYLHGVPGVQGGILSLPLQARYWREMGRVLNHAWEFERIAEELPLSPETVMVCQNETQPLFYRRARVFDFPELGMGNPGSRPDRADLYVLDSGNFVGNADQRKVNRILRGLLMDPAYRLIRYPNGVMIIIKKELLPAGESQ